MSAHPRYLSELLLAGARLAPLAAQLLLVALVLRQWGLTATGLLTLALSIVGLASLVDFGVSAGAARALGAAHAQSDTPLRAAILSTCLLFNASLVTLILGGVIASKLLLDLAGSYPFPFVFAMLPVAVFQMQRPLYERAWLLAGEYGPFILSRTASALVLTAGGWIVLQGPQDLLAVALVFVASLLPSAFLGLRLHGPAGELRSGWAAVSHQMGALQVVSIAAGLNALADRYIIAALYGVPAAGAFDPASRSSSLSRETMGALGQVPTALLTSFTHRADYTELPGPALHCAVFLVRRMALTALVPVLLSPILPELMAAGLGRDVALLAAILTVSTTLNALALPASTSIRALSHAQLEARYSLLGLFLNLALSVVLGLTLGFVGVGLATAVALLLSTTYFFAIIRRTDAELYYWLKLVYRNSVRVLVWVAIASVGAITAALRVTDSRSRADLIAYAVACSLYVAGIAIVEVRTWRR